MKEALTIEQRFALQRARYEVSRMSRPALEKTALKLLKTRMEQKNGVQHTLAQNGIMFKIDEIQTGLPEIISEETFVDIMLKNSEEDIMPSDINDQGFENDDLDDDGLMIF
jgi:hypothetical protein